MTPRAQWLTALGAFEAAARHQNFAHAAEELHLTASAVSHHVRKLEGLLGVALFQRHARGVALTAEGRQLADAAGGALGDVDAVFTALRRARADHGLERVRITTLHSFLNSWLLPRLPRFAAAHPGIRLSFDTGTALTRFDEGGPDLGIRHGPGQWPGLTAQYLMPDALFPVAAPTLPGLSTVAGPAEIAALPLLSDLATQGWREWFVAAGRPGAEPAEMHTFSDTTDALEAAAQGMGAALAREVIVAPWLASGRLVRLPGPTLTTRFSYFVVHPSHRRLAPAAAKFIEWVKREAKAS